VNERAGTGLLQRVRGWLTRKASSEEISGPARAEGSATIRNLYGFHVRPTTRFLELAGQYTCAITVEAGGARANGRNSLELLSLGARQGDTVQVRCEGEDAQEACDALLALIEDRFHGIE